jgi:DNA polymerase III psi subunit
VTYCDLQGITQWEFKDECVLKGPYGISVDNDGNVYVAGRDSINVMVFSPV